MMFIIISVISSNYMEVNDNIVFILGNNLKSSSPCNFYEMVLLWPRSKILFLTLLCTLVVYYININVNIISGFITIYCYTIIASCP